MDSIQRLHVRPNPSYTLELRGKRVTRLVPALQGAIDGLDATLSLVDCDTSTLRLRLEGAHAHVACALIEDLHLQHRGA